MKTKRLIVWICGVPLGLFALLNLLAISASSTPLGAILSRLPLGWWHFLQRNLPQMTFNWSLVATGAICSLLVIVVGNWLLGTLFGQIQRSMHPDRPRRDWRWRWTICMYVAVWLLFAIAFGTAGIFRHTTWLMDYGKPWFEERISPYDKFRITEMLVQELLEDNNQDLDATRKAIVSQTSYRRQGLIFDEFNVIFYADKNNKVVAYIIVPRNPQLESKGIFGLSIPGTNGLVQPLSELPRTIADLDTTYPQKK